MEYRKFNKPEQRESLVESGVFTQDELKKYITEEDPFFLKLKDTRFLPVKEGGVFKYFNYIKDLQTSFSAEGEKKELLFPYIKEKDTIVTLSKLTKAPKNQYQENNIHNIIIKDAKTSL